jgi:hypothetical protein
MQMLCDFLKHFLEYVVVDKALGDRGNNLLPLHGIGASWGGIFVIIVLPQLD